MPTAVFLNTAYILTGFNSKMVVCNRKLIKFKNVERDEKHVCHSNAKFTLILNLKRLVPSNLKTKVYLKFECKLKISSTYKNKAIHKTFQSR